MALLKSRQVPTAVSTSDYGLDRLRETTLAPSVSGTIFLLLSFYVPFGPSESLSRSKITAPATISDMRRERGRDRYSINCYRIFDAFTPGYRTRFAFSFEGIVSEISRASAQLPPKFSPRSHITYRIRSFYPPRRVTIE